MHPDLYGSAPRCAQCGVVIGVYEPLVRVVAGSPLATSRAAEPELAFGEEPWYHAACYERLARDESLSE